MGLHCGPAAGAVIGAHRAFYCLYGDTVTRWSRASRADLGTCFTFTLRSEQVMRPEESCLLFTLFDARCC